MQIQNGEPICALCSAVPRAHWPTGSRFARRSVTLQITFKMFETNTPLYAYAHAAAKLTVHFIFYKKEKRRKQKPLGQCANGIRCNLLCWIADAKTNKMEKNNVIYFNIVFCTRSRWNNIPAGVPQPFEASFHILGAPERRTRATQTSTNVAQRFFISFHCSGWCAGNAAHGALNHSLILISTEYFYFVQR